MKYEVRRKDRQIGREEILAILDAAEYGVVSMVGEDGVPYGIPVNLVRDGDRLIFHCALEGRKLDCLRHQSRVSVCAVGRKLDCLRHQSRVSVCAVGRTRVLPGQFTTEYESVIVEGIAEIVEDPKRKIDDLMKIVEKFDPEHLGIAPKAIEKSLHRTGVVEIRIESVTGKAKRTKPEAQPTEARPR